MNLTAEINAFTIMLLVLGIAIAGIAGFAYGSQWGNYTIETQVVQPGLTEADYTALIELEYRAGTCERLGLQTTMFWQQDDQNRAFATPICIQGSA